MNIETPKNFVPKFFDNTSDTYDRIANWATFGKDGFWKNTIINQMASHESILDLACGTGILTRKIASKFPHSKIIGVDITNSYILKAKKNSTEYRNITYILQDAEKLNLDQKFDCICSSYIPKYCNHKILVKNCISHLNPGGMIILHDFVYPKNFIIQRMWNFHFFVLKIFGIFIPEWRNAFRHLPKLIKATNWVFNYKKEFEQNGFDVKCIYMTMNTSMILVAKPKDSSE